ncbi:MAG: hypothetical protein JST49_12140 [Bacteroidetes bacterium]|nr:hypothetical protein [Bacteroidota bacterium]
MKTYLLIAAASITIFASQSCRKCYTCTSPNLVEEICRIDGRYEYAERGWLTDGQGDTLVCKF